MSSPKKNNQPLQDPLFFEKEAQTKRLKSAIVDDKETPSETVLQQLQVQFKRGKSLKNQQSFGGVIMDLMRFRLPLYQTIIISTVCMILVSYASLTTLQRTPQKGNWPGDFEKDSVTLVADSLHQIPGKNIHEDSLLTRFFQPVM